MQMKWRKPYLPSRICVLRVVISGSSSRSMSAVLAKRTKLLVVSFWTSQPIVQRKRSLRCSRSRTCTAVYTRMSPVASKNGWHRSVCQICVKSWVLFSYSSKTFFEVRTRSLSGGYFSFTTYAHCTVQQQQHCSLLLLVLLSSNA